MAHIEVKQGLDIPITGEPKGTVQTLAAPKEVALNLAPFKHTKFKLLKKVGDLVKIGEPIADDKSCPGRVFVSPAGGVVKEVRRGLKRRLLNIVIEVDQNEEAVDLGTVDISRASREEIVDRLLKGGMFAHIRHRPFNIKANPQQTPRNIFVKAVETAPYAPPAEMQVEGYEAEFQAGLTALSRLTDGKVHLVYKQGSSCAAFTDAKDVETHTVSGPHPAGNVSTHIHYIDPIQSCEDCVWTLTAHDVVGIGSVLTKGRYHTEKVVSVAGPGILQDMTGYFRVRVGMPVGALIAGRNERGLLRLISGDILTGERIEIDDFVGFYHFGFAVIPESVDRELLHFFRPGLGKFTATRTYLTGLAKDGERKFAMTTSNHGEHRAFIDGRVYDDMMPMRVPCMELVKSVMAEDFDTAEELGLLEVDAEDFALPTFICPSKIEMSEIMEEGLHKYALEVVH